MGAKVTLNHPIEAHGETLRELHFGEPTLGMLDEVGLVVTGKGELRIDLGDLHRIVSNLAGIPESSAKKIHLSDCLTIIEETKGFFKEFLPTGGS